MKIKVDVINLKNHVDKLSKMIDEYEQVYLNLYNELSYVPVYWQDDVSKKFMDDVAIKKINTKDLIFELNDIKKIYDYLIDKYMVIGDKIEYVSDSKNNILSKIDFYYDKLSEILYIYTKLDFKGDEKERLLIDKHIDKLSNMKKDITYVRNKIENICDLIHKIENNINFKISKLDISLISSNNINE